MGRQKRERGRKGKNDYALCQKPATRAGQTSALRVSVRQDLTGQSGQAGTSRDKPRHAGQPGQPGQPGETSSVNVKKRVLNATAGESCKLKLNGNGYNASLPAPDPAPAPATSPSPAPVRALYPLVSSIFK